MSQCARHHTRMIPLDLLFALTPTMLLACLWLADRIPR